MVAQKQSSVLEAARAWWEAGYSIKRVREDGSRAPVGQWKHLKTSRLTNEHAKTEFQEGMAGLFVILGYKNLGCFDFESEEVYEDFCTVADAAGLGTVVRRLAVGYLERSPGGYHLLFRCADIGEKVVLAAKTKEEARGGKLPLIEFLGMGQGVVVAPSHGPVHPSGKRYVMVAGGPATIVEITPEERDDLFALARSLDQRPPTRVKVRAPRNDSTVDGKRPGDVFNHMGPPLEELLLDAGWTLASVSTPEGVTYWTRPGKTDGVSASLNYQNSGLFYVWSSSASPLEAERAYDKFGAYTYLKHDGDWSAAAGGVPVPV
jgi:hypothetical protein